MEPRAENASKVAQYEEVLRRMASGVRAGQLYAREHPLLGKSVEGLLAGLKPLLQAAPSLAVGIVGDELVVADTPMPKASASMGELIRRLKDQQIERISFDRGVTADEVLAFADQGRQNRIALCAPRSHLG